MKRRHRHKKRSTRVIRLWNHDDVDKVLPYLRSVVGSLREHWLATQFARRQAQLVAARPGAHKRDALLALDAANENATRAETRFQDALAELSAIDVFLIDPVHGLALIPFRVEDELAWYVFDQFDKGGIVGWRYHHDPLEQRRPLELLPSGEASAAGNNS